MLFDHIEEKLNELRFFKQAMDATHNLHLDHVRLLRPPFDLQGKPIARAFQYNFSAYLSAHRAVRYYINRISGKSSEAVQWRAALNENNVLEALMHLRNAEIHDETMNMSTRTTVSNMGEGKADVKVSGLVLHEAALRAIRRLAPHPSAIEYLVSRPIVEIAEHGIRESEDAVREGRERGFLKPQPLLGPTSKQEAHPLT
jgi:hypothetical protein